MNHPPNKQDPYQTQPLRPITNQGFSLPNWLWAGLAIFAIGALGVICGAFMVFMGLLYWNPDLLTRVPTTTDATPTVTSVTETAAIHVESSTTEQIPTLSPTPLPPHTTPSTAPTVPSDPDPDNFIVTTIENTNSFDPAVNYDTFGWGLMQSTYETLVTYKREDASTLVPQLASDYDISDDGQTYTFTIREGISFHEGGTLTAEDVAYSFQRGLLGGGPDSAQILLTEPFLGVGIHNIAQLVDPALVGDPRRLKDANSTLLMAACEQVKNAIQANGNTVTMKLAQPWSPFLTTLAGAVGSILDKEWVISKGGWDGECSNWQNYYALSEEQNTITNLINGTAPYKHERGAPIDDEILLVANDNYWRNASTGPAWEGGPIGAPAVRQIAIKTVDQETALAMLQDGDTDSTYVSYDKMSQLDSQVGEDCIYNSATLDFDCTLTDKPDAPLRRFSGFPEASREDLLFVFNINIEGGNLFVGSGQLDGNGIPTNFFSDVHIRRAFNFCFDWQRYIDEAQGGEGTQNVGPIIPGLIGYNPNGPKYEHDLEKCAAEFRLAWDGQVAQNGFRMKIIDHGIITDILRANIPQVDPRYVIELINPDELPEDYNYDQYRNAGRFPFYTQRWLEDIHDPHNWVQTFLVGLFARTQRLPGEIVSQFGPLIDQGVVETDQSKRQAIYEQITQLDYDNAVAIRLAVPTGRRYEQRWVKGWYYNPNYLDFYYYALQK